LTKNQVFLTQNPGWGSQIRIQGGQKYRTEYQIRIRNNGKKDCVQEENECEGILVALGGTYMDKVMDVLLVHFQPNCLGNINI
jgi:hypothetical protein